MSAVTTLPAMLDALRTALAARTGLAGVNVFTADVDPESAGNEFLILASDDVMPEIGRPLAGGARHFETYSVPCFIRIAKPGAGETVIKAARDRAFALLEDVVDYLQSVKGTAASLAALGVRDAYVADYTLAQGIGESARYVNLSFTIRAESHFDPS